MASRGKRIKLQVGEDLSSKNVKGVIAYLGGDKATKKVACEMLGIKYNTTRLANIIESHLEDEERIKRLRSKKRGTPILKEEACSIVSEYLISRSYDSAAKQHFRSVALVKATIHKYGADLISKKTDYFKPIMLPELSRREYFEKDEIVWSARYNCMARILDPVKGGYWVWVLGSNAQQSAQATEELGSLASLTELGVNLNQIAGDYSEQR